MDHLLTLNREVLMVASRSTLVECLVECLVVWGEAQVVVEGRSIFQAATLTTSSKISSELPIHLQLVEVDLLMEAFLQVSWEEWEVCQVVWEEWGACQVECLGWEVVAEGPQ